MVGILRSRGTFRYSHAHMLTAPCARPAKLAISIARKLGALIFLTPEDIVELRAKLIMTFVGRCVL